ncbi:hypothetical protein B0H14DRAFT_3004240 [Mycena olivaceomarginata]|nr:hypothetical protein B0H14DRAFT_3004240 [Mycena olivaceomarginata]
MARIILSLVSVLLAFEVMAGMLIALLSLVHAIFNSCLDLVTPVQTSAFAAINTLGDISPNGPLALGFVNEGASGSGNTSVADVVSALQSAQSAMSGVTAGAFGENAEIRNAETTVKLMQGNQNITQAIFQAQKAVAANCTTA